MERLCPTALLLNFTNPEHKVCEAISRLTSIRSMGLCHGVFMGLHQIATLLERDVADLDAAACGMNHCTFFQYIRDRKTGEDLYPLLRERERAGDWLSRWHEIGLGRVMFRRFGLWPSPASNHYGEYINWAEEFVPGQLQYYYDPLDGHPWDTGDIPDFVYTINEVKDDRPWVKPPHALEPLDKAEMRNSGEVAIPIIEAVGCGVAQRIDAINVPNEGAIPNLPDDMVVEIPADGSLGKLQNCQMEPLPEALAAILRLHGSIHKLLVEAYAEGSRDKLIQAMLLEPTVDSYRRTVECVDEMLRLQQSLLPEFK
jgi:alpha-galactosidase